VVLDCLLVRICFGDYLVPMLGLQVTKIEGVTNKTIIDYEECRLLGYKNPVPTSEETHYVCATEPSRLMLCKV
jgi:hypothetical protein